MNFKPKCPHGHPPWDRLPVLKMAGEKGKIMGYESRLYVVRKGNFRAEIEGKEMFVAEKVAMFDLCKVPNVSEKMREYPATDCYIYENGNNETIEDCYGEPLREIPICDAIKILEEAAEREYYRRYAPCIQMLKGFDLSEWENLVVLHYGH